VRQIAGYFVNLNYLAVCTAALLIYELLLTFDHEYELIWKCVAGPLPRSMSRLICFHVLCILQEVEQVFHQMAVFLHPIFRTGVADVRSTTVILESI
jgi:hypothetical protein